MTNTTIPVTKVLISLLIYFILPFSAPWLNQFVDSLTITYCVIYSAITFLLTAFNWNVVQVHIQRYREDLKDCMLFTVIAIILLVIMQIIYTLFVHPAKPVLEQTILLHYSFFTPIMVLVFSIGYSFSFTLAFKIFVDRIHLNVSESMTILISGVVFGFLCALTQMPSGFDPFFRFFFYYFFISALASYIYNQTHSLFPMTLAYGLVLLVNVILAMI